MRKILFCFLLLLGTAALWAESEIIDLEAERASQESAKKEFRFKNRMVELGFGANISASQDFMGALDFFKETAEINIDGLKKGFHLDVNAGVYPLSLLFNWKDKWGFGLDVDIVTSVNLSLPESVLNLKQANRERFGAGAAVFVGVGIPVFFHVGEFKIKFRPSGYVPVAYAEPGVYYTNRTVSNPNGIITEVEFDMNVYAPFSLNGIYKGDITAGQIQDSFKFESIGYDFAAGVEYPLFPWLDLGADVINLPVVPSRLSHYMKLKDKISFDSSKIDINSLINGDAFPDEAYYVPEDIEPEYGTNNTPVTVFRPFKMLFHADYRPFDTRLLSLIPTLGFSINPLYVQKGAFEGGLSVRCDVANIFITTLGINYNDRVWKNSIDFVFNFRAFELDVGVASQSQDFVKSWKAGGVGVNVGVKLGF